MRTTRLAFLVLFGFWLIITESVAWDSMLIGAALAMLIVYWNRDILVKEDEFPAITPKRLVLLFRHLIQMIIEMVKANIQVVQIVLSPKMEFNQGLVIFTPKLRYSWNEVLFANSITLTPGTLTLDLEKDVYTVHLLEMSNADSLVSWNIQDNLRRLEEEE